MKFFSINCVWKVYATIAMAILFVLSVTINLLFLYRENIASPIETISSILNEDEEDEEYDYRGEWTMEGDKPFIKSEREYTRDGTVRKRVQSFAIYRQLHDTQWYYSREDSFGFKVEAFWENKGLGDKMITTERTKDGITYKYDARNREWEKK